MSRFGRFVVPPAGRPASSFAEVPVLCRLWHDRDEWNAAAVDLPVAVSASGLEEAQRYLLDAIVCRLYALQQRGQLESEVKRLKQIARECKIAAEEMSDSELLWRPTAKIMPRNNNASDTKVVLPRA